MSLIGALLGFVLLLFMIVMVVRAVVDWTSVGTGDQGWAGRVGRLSHTLTEPVIAPVRRVLNPVQIGSVRLDLAFTVVFLAALVLRMIVLTF